MISSFAVSVFINASVSKVWDNLADIATHIEWMDEAESISFLGSKREGVGTTYACVTKVGRFRLDDEMVVTEWLPGRRLAVQHDGIVQGHGTFTLTAKEGGTQFAWDEHLLFPFYLGGPIGQFLVKPFLLHTWQEDLQSLKDRVEGSPGINPIAFFSERGVVLRTHRKNDAWSVDLDAPEIPDFLVKDYATGTSRFAARAAAYYRWMEEEEPSASDQGTEENL